MPTEDDYMYDDEIGSTGSNEYDESLDPEMIDDIDDVISDDITDLAISTVNAKGNIFNKSAILPTRFDRFADKIRLQIKLDDAEKIFDEEEEEVEEQRDVQLPRILQGLAELTERYRQNSLDCLDSPMITKRKEMRALERKQKEFMNIKGKQMITSIVQHIEHLIVQGNYPREMFGDFRNYAENWKNTDTYDALQWGMKVVMCAEVIIPSQERLHPIKRISSALPTGVN